MLLLLIPPRRYQQQRSLLPVCFYRLSAAPVVDFCKKVIYNDKNVLQARGIKMSSVSDWVKKEFTAHRSFILYGLISVFVTVIDISVCRISEHCFDAVTANTLGVITGFIIQYFLTARHVYNTQNLKSFAVFLITFFIGLIAANSIVYLCRTCIFGGSDDMTAFLVSSNRNEKNIRHPSVL